MTEIEKYVNDYINNKGLTSKYSEPQEFDTGNTKITGVRVQVEFEPSNAAKKNSILNSNRMKTEFYTSSIGFYVKSGCWDDVRNALYVLQF